MSQLVLALDSAGSPNRWIKPKDAALYYVKDLVAWSIGETEFVIRGGTNRVTGAESRIVTASIISIKGRDFMVRNYDRPPPLTKDKLILRDRNMCAYCGGIFKDRQLEMEHIHPESRGGELSWMNIVAACRICNNRKSNRTPEEADMQLLYAPYVPNHHENFIMSNRQILEDQMEFLKLKVPAHSRLL
jgi:hypothetical protein